MSDRDASHIRFMEVGSDQNHSAVFVTRADLPSNGDARATMKARIADGRWRDGATQLPPPAGRRFERLLDIDALVGDVLYAIHLNATIDGVQRLVFRRHPAIVPIPLGVSGLELTDIDCDDCVDGSPRWASFRFDTADVPSLDGNADNLLHEHPLRIRIPFYLDVIDPVVGMPPWIFDEDEEGHPASDHAHDKAIGSITTHGGVHPPLVNYLVVAP